MFTKQMKRILFTVASVFMFLWILQLNPTELKAEQDGFWTYYKDYRNIDENGNDMGSDVEVAYISKYSGFDANVVIPETLGGCKVKGIDGDAFKKNKYIETVDVPTGVTVIGYDAFYECENLKTITGAENVKIIYSEAFYGCTNLESYPFYSGLKEIGDSAFFESGIRTAHIPETVTAVGSAVFRRCNRLTDLTIPVFNGHSSDTTLRVQIDGCTSLTNLRIIGSGHTGKYACEDFTSLKMVSFGEGITEIGSNMFDGCTSLEVAELPKSLKKIESNAFINCSSLAIVNMHEGLDTINGSAFAGCNSLTAVEIPNTVVEIGNNAFKGANMTLGSIFIPNSVTKIGKTIVTPLADSNVGITPNIICYEGSTAHNYAVANGYACDVRTPVPATSFTANSPIALGVDETIKLQYTMLPANHTDAIVWESSDKNIASVDNLGNITGKKPGQVGIIGTSTSGLRLNVIVQVSYKPSRIYFTNANGYSITSATVAKGASKAFTAVVYDNGSNKRTDLPVSYTSSNANVATVNSNGTITAKGVGNATITATCEGLTATLQLNVVALAKPKIKTIENTSTGIKISWNYVEAADSYIVYRKKGSGKWKKLATVNNFSSGTKSYIDKKTNNGTTYSYTVASVAGNVNSGYNKTGSKYVFLKQGAISSINNTASRKMKLVIFTNKKATGYEVYYSGKTKKFKGKSRNIITLKKLTRGKYYTFKVRSYKKVGKKTYYSAWSNSRSMRIR